MKQKRKVKSLNSLKFEGKGLLTAILLLLGGVLCFGAISLFTSSVGVEAASQEFTYKGIDDKVEVIFDLSFAPKNNLRKVINNMYLTTGGTFYMSGKVVNSETNGVIDGSNVNVLGGKAAGLASDNVTILGGKDNKILEGNPGAAVLGGEGNTVSAGGNKYGIVLLGGENNKIGGTNQDGNAIVGGENNKIEDSAKNSYILGGENNKIGATSKNVIVGGKGVTVNSLSNVFIFSDGSVGNPEESNAFYLNVVNGVGFGESANKGGVHSKGPVGFGEIGAATCTTQNLGVQGTLDGCLVGCTSVSRDNEGKWELIDHGDACEQRCQEAGNCMVYVEAPEPAPIYTSYCTVGNVDTGHSFHCASNLLNDYKNVLFETELIDSDDPCPNPDETENKCVFRCEPGYHLTGDATGKGDGTKCYANCVTPREPYIEYRHNEIITGYKVEEAFCSNSNGNHRTCADYKAKLVCNNGEWWEANSAGKAVRKNTEYTKPTCTLNQYRCNSTYNLSKEDILSNTYIKDTMNSWNWSNTDRGKSSNNAKRGIYEVCMDCNPTPNNPMLNGESYKNLEPYHYKLIGCRPGYATGTAHPNECREKCSFDGKDHYYKDGVTITAYMEDQRQCPNVCRATQLTCRDGQWEGARDTYTQDACRVDSYDCGGYDVNPGTASSNASTSSYLECEKLKAGNTNTDDCVGNGKKYKLNGCISNYHHNNGRTACESNTKQVLCDPEGVVPGYGEEVDYLDTVNITWQGAWNANNAWSAREKCGTVCDDDHHGNPGSCEDNCIVNTCDGYTLSNDNGIAHGNYDDCTIQYSDCTHGATKYKFLNSCESPYVWNGTSCEEPITCNPDACDGYTLSNDDGIAHGNYDDCTIQYSDCTHGATKYKFLNSCESPYVWNGTSCELPVTCTPDACDGYTLSNDNGIAHGNYDDCTIQYSDCTYGATKYKFLNSCESPYVWNGTSCEQPETCTPDACDGYTLSNGNGIAHGNYDYCDIVNDDCSGGGRKYKFLNSCETNYTWNGSSCEANTRSQNCGSAPSHSTWVKSTYKQTWAGNGRTPSSQPSGTCVTTSSSTIDCSFKCTGDYKCNSDNSACEDPQDESLCGSTKYGCTNGGEAKNTRAINGDDGYRWDCPDQEGCYKACPSGQVVYNGSCVTKDCSVSCGSKYFTCNTAYGVMSPINPRQYGANDLAQFKWDCGPVGLVGCTDGGASNCSCNAASCSSRGLSNNHDGYNCYQQLVPDDTCMGSVFCYSNGCPTGYTCYPNNDNVDIFSHPELYDIQALTNGYCVKAKSADQCVDYPFSACPTTHAQCFQCPSDSSKYKFSCKPSYNDCVSTLRGSNPDWYVKTYCPDNANCGSCQTYVFDGGQGCKADQTLYVVTSCKDSNYTLEDGSCISCADATRGWTQGTPNQYNCHEYYTKYVCGSNYYIDRGYQCSAGEVCNNGVCSSEPECQGTLISQSSVQYYQDILGYECNCDGDRCCCDAP